MTCENPVDGVNGNANIVLHIFPAHDFAADGNAYIYIDGLTEEETDNSTFRVVLEYDETSGALNYPLPGTGLDGISDYRNYSEYDEGEAAAEIHIKKLTGAGETYVIKVTQFLPGIIIDNRSLASTPTKIIDHR